MMEISLSELISLSQRLSKISAKWDECAQAVGAENEEASQCRNALIECGEIIRTHASLLEQICTQYEETEKQAARIAEEI